MSKLDEILDDLMTVADPNFKEYELRRKQQIKKLILDLFKEAEYDPYKFVEKVEAL